MGNRLHELENYRVPSFGCSGPNGRDSEDNRGIKENSRVGWRPVMGSAEAGGDDTKDHHFDLVVIGFMAIQKSMIVSGEARRRILHAPFPTP